MCPFGPPWRAYSPNPLILGVMCGYQKTRDQDENRRVPGRLADVHREHSRWKATGPSRSATSETIDMTVPGHHVISLLQLWNMARGGTDHGPVVLSSVRALLRSEGESLVAPADA
jgi:hypothetical protein